MVPDSVFAVWQRADVHSFAWSSDGERFATGMDDGRVVLWDTNRLVPLQQLRLHNGMVSAVGWSRDDTVLVATSLDQTVSVWEVEERRIRDRLTGHTGFILTLAWNPVDPNVIATSGDDKTVRVWDIVAGRETAVLLHRAFIHVDMAWSWDGALLATVQDYGRAVLLWRKGFERIHARLGRHIGRVTEIRWNPAGNLLAVGDYRSVELWDGEEAKLVTTLHTDHITTAIDWSHDGKRIAVGTALGSVFVWDVDPLSGEPKLRKELQPIPIGDRHTAITEVAWASDGSWLSASGGQQTFLWDVATWHRRTLNESGAWKLYWHPNGHHLATLLGSRATGAAIWPVPADRLLEDK